MTYTTPANAIDAIDRSASHDEIVHLPYEADVASSLLVECEGSTDSDTETEYWGTTDEGETWRVHMALAN